MKPTGSASELEARRRLAVARVNEGWSQEDGAASLGGSTRAVGTWMAAYRAGDDDGLRGRPRTGPKPKLSRRREQAVLSWLARSPTALGYATDLWTTRRLAEVSAKEYGVRFNGNSLAEWLTRRDHTPRTPEVKAGQRDHPAIARWPADDWPRVKKKPGTSGRTSP